MDPRTASLLVLAVWPWAEVNAQQESSTTFRVSTRVNAVCDISASNLDFGDYNAQSGSPLRGTTLVRATCTPNVHYAISLNEGSSPGATTNRRRMGAGTTSSLA